MNSHETAHLCCFGKGRLRGHRRIFLGENFLEALIVLGINIRGKGR